MIEYMDEYNIDGSKTGLIKTKDEIIKDKGFYKVVNLLIQNPKTKEFLIQKRASNRETNPNKWDLTCGGHLRANEDSIAAIIRESKEELNLNISKDKLIKMFELKTNDKKRILKDIYYLSKEVDTKNISLQKEEVSDIRYFSSDELIEIQNNKNTDFIYNEYFKDILNFINDLD